VPALAGIGAPVWSPDARGGGVGLSLATTPEELVRAVVWGFAAQIATLAEAMKDDLGQPLNTLRVDGGLSRSATLMQAQADPAQLPVERYPMADATALGVAALARLGRGAAHSPAEAVGSGSQRPSSSRRSAPTRPTGASFASTPPSALVDRAHHEA
jgi:glycerol kinase